MIEAQAAPVPADVLGPSDPVRVADRYEIERLLGRGGMASAYRAFDTVTGKPVALKRMFVESSEKQTARATELFEREFHTLIQLAHPRVVQAYDYGVDEGTPYYTMELLDGGDLQGHAPMRWQDLCVVAYEICSALSLLHSRKLVHRDLTPRNIRRTNDGKAKLIDFGLLSPMGPASILAGTPPFVPPELVNSVSLDGRSDLFSLGATLYFVLTGRLAFAARRFDRLRDAWRTRPPAPSKVVAGIPTALDDVIMTMLRIDAGSRPKSAAEVMERLVPLLEQPPDDELRVARAYLTTPRLVGRDGLVSAFRKRMMNAARRKGGGFLVSADAGLGRSRLLDAFVLEAKLIGATTLRAGSSHATGPFGVAAALAAQLHDAAPSVSLAAARRDTTAYALLFGAEAKSHVSATRAVVSTNADPAPEEVPPLLDVTRAGLDRSALQAALREWLLSCAEKRTLAIAIDDFDEIDEPSAALLASLTWEAPRCRLIYAVSVERGARTTAPSALARVEDYAERVVLRPLEAEETTELLASVFGETANLQLLSQRLHAICAGRPRECMALAQFLVDTGAITYGGGSFTLPGVIPEGLLPATIEDSLARQVAQLGPAAKRLGALLAVDLVGRLSRAELIRLDGAEHSAVDAGLSELEEMRLVTGDTSSYGLRSADIARLLTAPLTKEERAALNDKLAALHDGDGADPLQVAYHRLHGLRPEDGLDHLVSRAQDADARSRLMNNLVNKLSSERVAKTVKLALSEAVRLGRPTADQQVFWVMMAGISAQGEDAALYYGIGPSWLARLKIESGWNDWQSLDPALDPMARAMMALGAAAARYAGAPEAERALPPPDAIKQMVAYVVFSIAVAVRVSDLDLMASLPELLEPFAGLNPMVAAMLANARGTLLNGLGKRESAREAFLDILKQLDAISGTDFSYLERVRAAINQTLAEIDASLGLKSFWVERLEKEESADPNQQVGAIYVQKVAALHQGDWEGAERHRQRAELAMLQSRTRPMFSTLGQELEAHALARDLTGLKQVKAGLHAMAAEHPGWLPVMHVADAQYLRLCGDLEGAREAALSARAIGLRGRVRSPWAVQAVTLEAAILTELGRPEEAIELAEKWLAECEHEGMRYLARGLSCAIAEAEAKLGRVEAAMKRVDGVIAEQLALGVTGLHLGYCYELAARIALPAGDAKTFERFAALTAQQYRPGQSSVLGALYERLMEDARQGGLVASPGEAASSAEERILTSCARVTTILGGCNDREERIHRALGLLCDGEPPSRGHLFLLTERGLVLAASNVAPEGLTELMDFARSRVEQELADPETMTAAIEEGMVDMGSTSFTWKSRNGTSYDALLLAAPLSDGIRVTGVALLTRGVGSPRDDLDDITVAVARALIESGDAVGVRAA